MKANRLLERLRRAFLGSGLSLRQVSIQASVPYASVHGIFKGTRDDITLRNTARICEVLGLEFSPVSDRENERRNSADFRYTMKLPNGRKLRVDIPRRWFRTDRGVQPAFTPEAVAFLDGVRVTAMNNARRKG